PGLTCVGSTAGIAAGVKAGAAGATAAIGAGVAGGAAGAGAAARARGGAGAGSAGGAVNSPLGPNTSGMSSICAAFFAAVGLCFRKIGATTDNGTSTRVSAKLELCAAAGQF